jgi:hypothetical protein
MNKYFQYEEGAFTVEEFDEDGWELTDIVYMSSKTEGSNKLSFFLSEQLCEQELQLPEQPEFAIIKLLKFKIYILL